MNTIYISPYRKREKEIEKVSPVLRATFCVQSVCVLSGVLKVKIVDAPRDVLYTTR